MLSVSFLSRTPCSHPTSARVDIHSHCIPIVVMDLTNNGGQLVIHALVCRLRLGYLNRRLSGSAIAQFFRSHPMDQYTYFSFSIMSKKILEARDSFLSTESWTGIRAALVCQSPLRNFHWKSASRPSIRTIQALDVTLLPLEAIRDEHTSQIPATLLEKPLLNIYIVTCEDVDVESYRNTVKRQIKDWHSTVAQRKNQEWLILHIVKPDAKIPSGNFFQLKGSVLDKMKTDFNVEKRDRCVQLVWSASGNDNPAVWADLITKIKDGILSAFDSAVTQREEEVKRSEGQRQMPGWNFCTFFVLKESLASSFEGVNLFEDALQQYDELETSFYQVLKEKNLSWFGSFISPSSEDDSLPLLSITKKPYRDLILANNISVFDFRIYLLARQCALLGKMGRVNEVSRKVGAFLGAFGRRLRDVEVDLPEFFVESWTYSSALSVVDQCDVWAVEFKSEESSSSSFHAGKGELIELALKQLDTIGIKVGHLPAHPPFSITFAHSQSEPTQKRTSLKISKPELLSSLESRDAFYDLYVGVANRAIDMYTKAGRRKFALKLHGSLAALDVHRGRLSTAVVTYASLPAHYSPHMWTSLESYMLSRALDTHADLGKSKDGEWIHTLLSFLKAYIDNPGEKWLMHNDNRVEYISSLVGDLKEAAGKLESVLAYPDHPAISVQGSHNAKTAETEDGSFLDVTINNYLPCPLPVDEVSVLLVGRDSERLKFASAIQVLAPGKTSLQLFCPTSSSGTYLLNTSDVRMSKLLFQWNHKQTRTTIREHSVSTLVRIPRDLRALKVRLRQPHRIELGTPPKLLATVHTGRNHIISATVKLSGPTGIHFQYSDATLQSGDPVTLQAAKDSLKFADVAPDRAIPILVPYSDTSAFNAMKVIIDIEYVTSNEPTITRTLRVNQTVATSLPVAVNVQDFFRGTRLFSKFTISTTTDQLVRLSSAQLEVEGQRQLDGVQIVGCMTQKQCFTVTPSQPANFLFYLDSAHGPVRESLTLFIKYRMLREEVESLIETSVHDAIELTPSFSAHRDVLVNRLVDALDIDSNWVETYRVTGELDIPGHSEEDSGDIGEALKLVRQKLRQRKCLNPQDGEWHEIVIPVDVPRMTIVAAARISLSPALSTDSLASEAAPFYAGQPISAIMSIHTSFHWGSRAGDKEHKYMMRFDVEEMVKDWLVSGRKRGDFAAMDDKTYTVPITLIALHHGEIALPKIAVTALPLAGELTMGSMAIPSTETYQLHGAEKVLVLPRGGRTTFALAMGESPSQSNGN